MALVSAVARAGSPTQEPDGFWRGTALYTFDDGRVFRRAIVGTTEEDWSVEMNVASNAVIREVSESDARASITSVDDIAPAGQATAKQRAVAYLRDAMNMQDPYEAYLLFDKFNTFRTANGWSVNQVADALQSEGLKAEDWYAMKTIYSVLSAGASIMQQHKDIEEDWDNRFNI